jgi:RNA polymerase sigma-70 factor (ECF subfamily)
MIPESPRFRTTCWSLVLAASNPEETREALATLCRIYWRPVYGFIRRNGHDADNAQDLTQEFFARLIEKNYLGDADRRRGRFRSFLLTSVRHFLANEWDRRTALKRGGGYILLSTDALGADQWYASTASPDETPERLFERRWALALLDRVMDRLHEDYVSAGKARQFEMLQKFLTHDADHEHYAQLAAQTGLSVGALRMAVLRMRRKYASLLHAEVAETVETPDEVDEEIRFLWETLSKD